MMTTLRSKIKKLATHLGLRTDDSYARGLVQMILKGPDGVEAVYEAADRYRKQLSAESANIAAHYGTVGRVRARGINFRLALKQVNEIAGGEPRRVRRAMARAKAKREWLKPVTINPS